MAHVCTLLLLLFACSSSSPVDAGLDSRVPDAPVDVPVDVRMVDVRMDAPTDADAVDTRSDSGAECVSHSDCAARLGVPALPEGRPCGSCWAVCGEHPDFGGTEGTCGQVCFEAADCVFTAGCGPNCEPLCDTTEDCLLDDVCLDGVCVAP